MPLSLGQLSRPHPDRNCRPEKNTQTWHRGASQWDFQLMFSEGHIGVSSRGRSFGAPSSRAARVTQARLRKRSTGCTLHATPHASDRNAVQVEKGWEPNQASPVQPYRAGCWASITFCGIASRATPGRHACLGPAHFGLYDSYMVAEVWLGVVSRPARPRKQGYSPVVTLPCLLTKSSSHAFRPCRREAGSATRYWPAFGCPCEGRNRLSCRSP